MRTLCKVTVVLGLAALLASPALAQRPGGGFRGLDLAGLIGNKSVQEEVKLEKEQIDKATEALRAVNEKFQEDRRKLFNPQTSAEERAEITKKIADATAAAVKDIIKEDQMKRIKQIQLQQRGLRAFEDAEVVKTVKITDDQAKDIKAISDEVSKERAALFPMGQRPAEGAQEKMAKINTEAKEKVVKMFSADQKKAWEELTGKPFEIKFEPRPPRP
jgi:hypothetical protein